MEKTDKIDKIDKIDSWGHFNNFFKEFLETQIQKLLGQKGIAYYDEFKEAVLYPLINSGKFFRPYLLYQTCDFILQNSKQKYSLKLEDFLPFAISIELVHNYSLVHDDLPAMDNSDYRRGILTVHKKYGEAEAILVGDALLTFSFQILTDPNNVKLFNLEKIIKVINEFCKYIGKDFLIIGQYLDIKYQKGLIENNVNNIKTINYYKTAGLILLAIKIPLILLNPEYNIKYSLIKYGFNLGYLFQYTDDYIDKDGIYELLPENELKKLIDFHYTNAFKSIQNFYFNQNLKQILDFIYNRIN